MSNLSKAIASIGRDIGEIQGKQTTFLSQDQAYSLFPTYASLQNQMESNIKNKHVDLGLDALIDEKLQNGGDSFVTKSQLPTSDIDDLKKKVDKLEEMILDIKRNVQT